MLVIAEGRLMNHDKRNQAGIQGSLQVSRPFLPIGRIIPPGPVQRVANVLDTEVPDICHALLVQAMDANPDQRSPVEDRHQSKTNAHQPFHRGSFIRRSRS